MPKVKVSDIEMHYECIGEGDPVVLVTGYGMDHMAWAMQAPMLAPSYQVYMVDNRGVGKTDKPKGPYTIKMMADDLAGFFKAVGIKKAHLVGHSMGGMISQQFALDHPELLRSVTLASTSCRIPKGADLLLMLWTDIIEKLGVESFVNNIIGWCFTFDFIESQYDSLMMFREMTIDHLTETPLLPEPFRAQCAAITSFNVADKIKNIKVPTMVLVGKGDILTPVAFSEEIAKRISGSFLNVIEGGHAFNSEVPSAFNQALLDFFEKH
ncbi:MAG: alpha/beta fold hydrolase [Candidatus Abyssobacteria bacterium SURF_17]|uniref:Alpha/beta fold hydrolase n=1 Tax=Candidatus Abyssobacteria bacterium SURF_17 TaxID=2093361 RepID=A0A419F2H1_9BACT|nr:MAG: alpha/beta fold hydrolase [Candidatus Abyssubacteria bacterium SURF_17]